MRDPGNEVAQPNLPYDPRLVPVYILRRISRLCTEKLDRFLRVGNGASPV